MEIRELGEFGLIDRLKEQTIFSPDLVLAGIGDDCAVVRHGPGTVQLMTTDMLVEDIHFTLTTSSPQEIGYKSMAVNFSDIAAMGGQPRHALVSIALPRSLPVEFVTAMYAGMKEICAQFGVNIVGGDTVASPKSLVINVALTGDAAPERVVMRKGARPGDLVAVSGTLGDSAAGLELLLTGQDGGAAGVILKDRHRRPQPRVVLGQRLAAAGVTSMDDISDGLASELLEIAVPSQVDLVIDSAALPLSTELQTLAGQLSKDLLHYALYGGEDFQLLFTLAPHCYDNLPADIRGAITLIGTVQPGEGRSFLLFPDGQREQLQARGYNHFREDVEA